MKAKSYKPENRHSVTPFIVVNDANKALDFYAKAFAAKELMRMPGPDGKIMHAEILIGDSVVCLNDEMPQCGNLSPKSLGGCSVTLFVYVPDVDASFKQAVDAGCESKMPPADMFWGDRFASVADPFGHQWSFATRVEDLTEAEIKENQAKFCAQMAASVK